MRLPDNPQSSKPAPCGCRSTGRSLDLSRRRVSAAGFSLIELLVVVAIISIMAGLLTLALQGVRAPAVRGAASQVTSGLSLARQVAITKNTKAALFIANDTANGRIPYRHWSVGYSNKFSGNWTLSKKWEPLPEGAVFLQTLTSNYSVLTNNVCPQQVGQPEIPTGFANTTNITIDGTPFTGLPYILFGSDGVAISGNATTPLTNAAIRIASGLASTNGQVTITSTNQYFFVETDGIVGRIRMRAPESYNDGTPQ
jgi:prepilin-type N-terminal cleavage/methylation domain-containing protein